MFEHRKIQGLNDFFMELDSRKEKGVYFYRINGFNEEIREFIGRYYEAARLSGVVIEGRIPNPDERNLSYYNEIMGMDFQMSMGFITSSLRKWLPRMNDFQRNQVAASMYDSLDSLRRAGKNENMLKNAYIKFMCWLYYKFERIVNQLGGNRVPKILYEGEISSYELMLVSILSHAGCDVVLLQYRGDDSYRRLDAPSALSDSLALPEMEAFPEGFCIRSLREQMQQKAEQERLYGKKPQAANCTNAWISGEGLADITLAAIGRGSDPKLFYNCFIRINGAEDKLVYMNELYQFYLELKNAKRRLVIVDGGIPQPDMQEIGNTQDPEEAYRVGETIGRYVKELGFNVDFAPVADVASNPDNQVIGSRSFGSDAGLVSQMVAREVQGMQEQGVSASLKHFPGHGDTSEDSHAETAVSKKTADELRNMEFLPFKAGIEAGVDMVMIGHISVPAITGSDIPASLSEQIITGCLREELGYQGIVVTDSMSMGAIVNTYTSADAAVRALQAGCDMLLMPQDFQAARQAVLDAVKDSVLSEERLDESLRRIFRVKLRQQ